MKLVLLCGLQRDLESSMHARLLIPEIESRRKTDRVSEAKVLFLHGHYLSIYMSVHIHILWLVVRIFRSAASHIHLL